MEKNRTGYVTVLASGRAANPWSPFGRSGQQQTGFHPETDFIWDTETWTHSGYCRPRIPQHRGRGMLARSEVNFSHQGHFKQVDWKAEQRGTVNAAGLPHQDRDSRQKRSLL